MAEQIVGNCDKCGKPVTFGNDAAGLQVVVGDWTAITATPRHLMPTADCEGSPSRHKLIATDEKWKSAYEKLQQEAKTALSPKSQG